MEPPLWGVAVNRVDVLAVMDRAAAAVESDDLGADVEKSRTAVAELIEAGKPLSSSLVARIDADNAMTPQAVMVRRFADALARVQGGQP